MAGVAALAGGLWAGLLAGTLMHELGHAVAARLVGVRVLRIEVGKGPRLVRLGPLHIAAAPFHGRTLYELVLARAPRLRSAVIAAGGPAANVVSVALIWRFRTVLVDGPLAVVSVPTMFLSIAQLISLVPMRNRRTGQASDGLLILREMQGRSPYQRLRDVIGRLGEVIAALAAGDVAAAESILDGPRQAELVAALTSPAIPPTLRRQGVAVGRAVLGAPVADAVRGEVANELAWAAANGLSDEIGLVEAEDLAREAVRLLNSPGTHDTLALVLVRRGRFAEAYDVAAPVAAHAAELAPQNGASVLCTLALAADGLDQRDEAAGLFAQARSLWPACPLLPRAAPVLQTASPG